jgi:hypothetical protein
MPEWYYLILCPMDNKNGTSDIRCIIYIGKLSKNKLNDRRQLCKLIDLQEEPKHTLSPGHVNLKLNATRYALNKGLCKITPATLLPSLAVLDAK